MPRRFGTIYVNNFYLPFHLPMRQIPKLLSLNCGACEPIALKPRPSYTFPSPPMRKLSIETKQMNFFLSYWDFNWNKYSLISNIRPSTTILMVILNITHLCFAFLRCMTMLWFRMMNNHKIGGLTNINNKSRWFCSPFLAADIFQRENWLSGQ